MGKSEDAMRAAIQILQNSGFAEDGRTKESVTREAILTSPIFGGSGGVLVKSGGRLRFDRNGIKATVGKRTVFVYRVLEDGGLASFGHLRTDDEEGLKQVLAALPAPEITIPI